MPDPSSSLFSLPLLQAITIGRSAGGKNQKAKRGQELKRQAASLPDRFRSCDLICYLTASNPKPHEPRVPTAELLAAYADHSKVLRRTDRALCEEQIQLEADGASPDPAPVITDDALGTGASLKIWSN